MGGAEDPPRERARALRLSASLRYDLPSGGAGVDTLDNELDRLYGLDPGDFVGERDGLARELRDAGRREEAEQVKSLRKPSVSAWTINQLARKARRDVDLLLDAGHRLREAQEGVLAGKDRTRLDEARETEREALASLRDEAVAILAEAGRGGEPTLNRVMQTLQAAAVSTEGRELLARGRFTGDLEATGFELLAPLAGGKPRRTTQAPPKKARARPATPDRARQREQLEAARDRLREARAAARAAQQELREAERDAGKARRELTKAEERVEKRDAAAAEAQDVVAHAEQELREAEKK